MALAPKQTIFSDEYLIDLNATRAYKIAYPKVKKDDTAAAAGARMLRNVKVAEYIQKRMKEREKRTEITQDRVLQELAKIAFVNATEVIDPKTATIKEDALPEDTAAIQSVKVKTFGEDGLEREIKMADKLKALELLGKHLGMFKDKVELSGGLDTEKTKLDDLLRQMRGGGLTS